jgi:hypothetical protein
MVCPDENLIASWLEGRLREADVAALERHVDQCADCLDLVTSFGRAYSPSLPPRVPRPTGLLVWAEIAFAALQVAGAAVVTSCVRSGRLGSELGTTLAISALLGAVVALYAVWALRRERPQARTLCAIHAALALPSVVLAPVAAWVLIELRRTALGSQEHL